MLCDSCWSSGLFVTTTCRSEWDSVSMSSKNGQLLPINANGPMNPDPGVTPSLYYCQKSASSLTGICLHSPCIQYCAVAVQAGDYPASLPAKYKEGLVAIVEDSEIWHDWWSTLAVSRPPRIFWWYLIRDNTYTSSNWKRLRMGKKLDRVGKGYRTYLLYVKAEAA